MQTLLKLEYIALFLLGVVMFGQSEYEWWWFLVLFFVPDVSMVGYLANPKIGAMFYNFAHHFGTAVIVFILGKYLSINELTLAGGILLAHSAFDRILGFGLKYSDDFKNTHLGKIGKESN
ncbi:hypothetical protein CGC56_05925 [Capnocytophaga canimorsus]|uniref:DUF4260 domain-containing protein n=1 Tax=Capnocytophaga canimorsus TaxID=28188 RepID=A0A250G2V7_9FLAO|nr:DUF4260 domain-containing protein [Capnocytophaga canimorsus]ATA91749.1 hypothetical protein CGC56_05925 [Capnocytophaga canimorsus]